MTIPLSELELEGTLNAKEIYTGEESELKDEITVTLKAHGARAFKLMN